MRNRMVCLLCLSASLLGCGGGTTDNTPVTIALLAPKTGPLESVGTSFENIYGLAVDNINNSGGINGRLINKLVIDTQLAVTGAPPCHTTFQNAVDQGAIAVVGPAASGEVKDCYPTAATDHVPLMSPSSTAPSLSQRPLTPTDDGYMFRDVPDDSIQTKVISYYLGQMSQPPVTNVAVVYEDSPYGDGLRQAFVGKFTGAPVNGTVDIQLKYCQNFPTDTSGCGQGDIFTATDAIAQLTTQMNAAATPPKVILMVALEQDALKLVDAWDTSTDPVLKAAKLFFVDGAHTGGFLAGAPASIRGMCGTTPTYPTNSIAYTTLSQQYAAAFPTGDLGSEAYGPNVWDAVHLFAAAMLQQAKDHPDEPLGGSDLRDEVTTASKDGQTVTAADWRTMIADVNNGTNIDYDGASGPQDFDANQSISPYEVWCIAADGASFTQQLYLDASQVAGL